MACSENVKECYPLDGCPGEGALLTVASYTGTLADVTAADLRVVFDRADGRRLILPATVAGTLLQVSHSAGILTGYGYTVRVVRKSGDGGVQPLPFLPFIWSEADADTIPATDTVEGLAVRFVCGYLVNSLNAPTLQCLTLA